MCDAEQRYVRDETTRMFPRRRVSQMRTLGYAGLALYILFWARRAKIVQARVVLDGLTGS